MSSDELLEVVDAQDRVVGLERRREIHRRRLMHRSAHVLLVNTDGALFLQQRAAHKDECPGMWDSSAAGHVDPGESYEACARRELGEELGVPASVELLRLGKMQARADTGFEHAEVFLCRYDGPLRLDPLELADGQWLSCEAMDARVAGEDATLTLSLCLIWKRFRELLLAAPAGSPDDERP